MENTKYISSILHYKDRLKRIIEVIPNSPGTYLFKDKDFNLLYVGKSKNLRNRVKSYFLSSKDLSPRIALMVLQIYDIEVIVTDTESEALTLESNLIKSKQPYFNILLKDDKKYPYLCITWSDDYPRIYITRRRRLRNIKDKYYGPYVDVTQLRNTLELIKKIFPIRQRPTPLYKNRTCLNYDIGRCPGVCQEFITAKEYRKTIEKISMIFQGRSQILLNHLTKVMKSFSDQMQFEKAAQARDQIKAVQKLIEAQKMTLPDSSVSRDVINLTIQNDLCCVQIFQMRAGRLVGRLGYLYDSINLNKEVLLQKVIEEHYSKIESVEFPSEILIPYPLPKIDYLIVWLTDRKCSKINVLIPKRNDKAELISLVKKNAEIELKRLQQSKDKNLIEIEDLAQLLQLDHPPKRIEGYDISHIQGSNAVASQVVFIHGIPAKQHYRRYSIKNQSIKIGHSDDYMALREVIERRFRRWSEYKKEGADLNQLSRRNFGSLDPVLLSDWPDLIMIDGGKGQLNAVMKSLKKMDLDNDINVCSLAKKQEQVYVPGSLNPIESDKEQYGILLLRRLRDEAHRFAINFHRKKRSKAMKRSHLVEIPGVGPIRIKALLAYFNSIQALQLASIEEISKVDGIGRETANVIWKYFHP